MKLKEVTWGALEEFEATTMGYTGSGVTRFNRGVVIAARDAGIAEDLPDWAQDNGPLDRAELDLGKRDEVLTMATEIIEHVQAAKAPADPN
jgi:hypothetical protein